MKGPERDAKGKPTRLLLSLRAWGASSKADARAKARAISNWVKEHTDQQEVDHLKKKMGGGLTKSKRHYQNSFNKKL